MKQLCTHPQCRRTSVPGLIKGTGKCQYHWNAGVWGKEWANAVEAKNPSPPNPKLKLIK